MIQGLLTFEYFLNQSETGEIEPEFRPMQLIFSGEKFNKDNYSDLLTEDDLFALFYEHTTGKLGGRQYLGGYSNFYTGRLKQTPYRVLSFFRQESDESKFLTISIFELEDDIEIYENLIKNNAERLKVLFNTLLKVKRANKLSLIEEINKELGNELSFTVFRAQRLSTLSKLQKVALIFNSEERLKTLEILRENAISKTEFRKYLEEKKPDVNMDIVLEPFLDLNLIRRDWIQGIRDRRTGKTRFQGEYLFLTKDIILARVPNHDIINKLKNSNKTLYSNYEQKLSEFFSRYDPLAQSSEEVKKLASFLLSPDEYDFFDLLRKNYYPLDKIPKILSEWADTEEIINNLKALNIITEITDENDKTWIVLLTDIEPLVIFPEFLLINIKETLKKTQKSDQKISREIAKKALNLLEITFPEKIIFN